MLKPSKIYFILLFLFLVGFSACERKTISESGVRFNQTLADEIAVMAEIDQVAAYVPQGEYLKLSSEEWQGFKDSVFRANQIRIQAIFEEYGYPGYDLIGEAGASNFWVMVQHSDHMPEFQKAVLEKMKVEVDAGNADSRDYGLLVDRVKLNTGEPQVYGTQVDYNFDLAQAFPMNLAEPETVNDRRRSIGLEPIEVYLNDMSQMNFEMNKAFYLEKGVKEPTLYPVE